MRKDRKSVKNGSERENFPGCKKWKYLGVPRNAGPGFPLNAENTPAVFAMASPGASSGRPVSTSSHPPLCFRDTAAIPHAESLVKNSRTILKISCYFAQTNQCRTKKMKNGFQIKKVVIVGAGNVAWHLARALTDAGFSVVEVCSRHMASAGRLAEKIRSTALDRCEKVTPDADMYLLAVSDAQIETVARALPPVNGVVCHTSGTIPISALHHFRHFGVFYPLQTFSRATNVDLSQVPFCIEASSEQVCRVLFDVAGKLSRKVFAVNTPQRLKLHLAAVLVNNFTNHLFGLAAAWLRENNLDPQMLLPLLNETAAKLNRLPAAQAQTGPAKRGDVSVIEKHLQLLEQKNPELHELYRLFSHQILKQYHE